MMRLIPLLIIVGLTLLSVAAIADEGSHHLYWVAYTGITSVYHDIGPRYVMEIDEAGNVIKPPVIVLSASNQRTFGSNALSPAGENRLVLWVSRGRYSGGPPQNASTVASFYRVLLNRKNLKVLSIDKLPFIGSRADYVSVTQRKKDNFLTALIGSGRDNFLTGFHLPTVQANDAPWLISPQSLCTGEFCTSYGPFGGLVSADGRRALLASLDKLYVQPLSDAGLPMGRASLLAIINRKRYDGGMYNGCDITNRLRNGNRFLVYVTAPYSMGTFVPNRIFVQQIDSNDRRIGHKIKLLDDQTFQATQGQVVAIDPGGHFVLYAANTLSNQSVEALVFQALDSFGHPIGTPKIIASHAICGVDLLEG